MSKRDELVEIFSDEQKVEELENKVEAERLAKEKEGMEWAARRH